MSVPCSRSMTANNAINAESKKRRGFVAPLFATGYGERQTADTEVRLWESQVNVVPKRPSSAAGRSVKRGSQFACLRDRAD
jgi:hypothetical protein